MMRTFATAWLASVLAAQDAAADAVKQLADAGTRAAAHAKLVALGAAAVPALEDAIGEADVDLVDAALSVLDELGPVAGRAMPRVLGLYCWSQLRGPRALATLVELAPWRPLDGSCDWDAIEQARSRRRHQAPEGRELELWERLRLRCTFARDADVDTLLAALRSRNPWRVELAIQLLGTHPPGSGRVMDALQLVLERPEPRILPSGERVPLHRRAAVAVLALSPTRQLEELARARLAGGGPVSPLPPEMPARLRTRIAELVAELAEPAKSAAAVSNLLAIGEVAAPQIAAALARKPGDAAVAGALSVLRELAKRSANSAPELAAALPALPVEHATVALQILQEMAPEWYGRLSPVQVGITQGHVAINEVPLEGALEARTYQELLAAARAFNAVLRVDPETPIAELGDLLGGNDVFLRERALAVAKERGREAVALLPAIAKLMSPPDRPLGLTFGRDRTVLVQLAAARAVVAVAAPDDPLVAEARALLGTAPK